MKDKKQHRLTEDQKHFAQLYGHLIQDFNVPKIAKMWGVTPQAVQQQVDKVKEEKV